MPGIQTEVDRGDSSSRGTAAPQDASLVRRLRDRARESGLPARLARRTRSATSAAGARRSSGASRRSSPSSSTRSTPSSRRCSRTSRAGSRSTRTRPGASTRRSSARSRRSATGSAGRSCSSFLGLFIGSIVAGRWFPGEPYGELRRRGRRRLLLDRHGATVGLPAADRDRPDPRVWLFNVFGARVGVTFGYVAGVLLMIPLFVMMILPFLNGSFDSANLTNKLSDSGLAWGGLQLALVWLWMMMLVGLGGRRLRDVRARVQGHRARHEAGAALGGAVLDGRLHPPADRLVGGVGREARRARTTTSAR